MLLTTIPFPVYTFVTKLMKDLGPVGLSAVTGTISYLAVRGIAPTVESIYRALRRRGQ